MLHKYELNKIGTDYAVGDIHGNWAGLQAKLDEVGFNSSVDRLFSCGDLVDRGVDSDLSLEWLAKPWFHPVRGNHDDYVVRYKTCDHDNWVRNGGIWFFSLLDYEKQEFCDHFSLLPHAIQVDTRGGLVGLCHADPIVSSWPDIAALTETRSGANQVMWTRDRMESENHSIVDGVKAVIVGHTPVQEPVLLGNVLHIDTAGWHKLGYFTLINLATMRAAR